MGNFQNKQSQPTGFDKKRQSEQKTPSFQDTHGKPLTGPSVESKNPLKGQPNMPGKMKH